MKSLACSGFLVLCVFGTPLVFTAESSPPNPRPGADVTSKDSIAGDYAGSWKSSGDSAGKLHLKLKQESATWIAEASFTFEDAVIATKVKSIKVEGAKLEIIFEWEIQGTPGESKLAGELAGDKLQGTYASRTGSSNSNGTWTVTRS